MEGKRDRHKQRGRGMKGRGRERETETKREREEGKERTDKGIKERSVECMCCSDD